jgi:hypothetical protein
VRVLLPVGAVKAWAIEDVPLVSLAEPSIAAYRPLCGLLVVTEQRVGYPGEGQLPEGQLVHFSCATPGGWAIGPLHRVTKDLWPVTVAHIAS